MNGYQYLDFEELFEQPKSLIGKRVGEKDYVDLIYPGTIVRLNGKPIIVYGTLPEEFGTTTVRAILQNLKYSKNRRLTQYKNKADLEVAESVDINFGFNPPNRIFGTTAGSCMMSHKYPAWSQELGYLGGRIARELYSQLMAETYRSHIQYLVEHIHPRWLIEGTPFTQGVVNNANQLGYHFDRDNIPNAASCMVYLKRGVQGGNLAIPGLRAKLICQDRAFMLFDGQSIMHGVTPIKSIAKESYRYSIVYYARDSMVGLGTMEEEMAKSQDVEYRKHVKRMEEPAV